MVSRKFLRLIGNWFGASPTNRNDIYAPFGIVDGHPDGINKSSIALVGSEVDQKVCFWRYRSSNFYIEHNLAISSIWG